MTDLALLIAYALVVLSISTGIAYLASALVLAALERAGRVEQGE